MKWMIAAPDMLDKNLSLVENFLDSQNAEYVEVFLSQETSVRAPQMQITAKMTIFFI